MSLYDMIYRSTRNNIRILMYRAPSSSIRASIRTSVQQRASIHRRTMFDVSVVPILKDNYAYLLVDKATKKAAVVDPSEPALVINAATEAGVHVTHILCTHSHWDHAGGNEEMRRIAKSSTHSATLSPELVVVGGRGDDAEGVTHEVGDGDCINVGDTSVQVFSVPCHTKGHVLYYIPAVTENGHQVRPGALMTGDTLFVAGCGRFNNGTPAQMHYALNTCIASLPQDTELFVGHEYTEKNLEFASHVEPHNADINLRKTWANQKRANGQPTVPSTIHDELATNPFMRVNVDTVRDFCNSDSLDAIAVMKHLRESKNSF